MSTGLAMPKARVPIRSNVPEGWRHVRLTDVARLESGHTPSKRQPDYWGGTIPWVSLHDTEGLDAREIQTTSQNITEAGLANSSARLLPKGTVVFSRTATVGKSTVMGCAMATSQDFACYVCGPAVHNFYLALLLRSMRTEWKKLMAGSIHNTVYMPVFKALSVDLPPHDEQVAISNAMRDVERAIDSLQQLLTKKRQIKEGAMQELLTGKRRLLDNGEAWRQVPLGSLGRWSGGMTPSMARADYWSPAEVPWLSSGDLKTSQLSESARYVSKAAVRDGTTTIVPAKSVVVVMRSGILRKYLPVGITLRPMAINQDLKAIQPNSEVAAEFLLHALTYWGERILATCLKAGTTVESLELRWLKAFTIDLPSVSEQVVIAGALSDMDTEITALEESLTKARALKQAMAQALLTGRIRLVEPTA